ncbi:MAG: hypothetical protein U0Q18_28450 [Bryobacteraceae bacterium]
MRRIAPALLFIFGWAALAQPLPPQLFDGLKWRLIGPFRGGRTEAATGVPGDPNTFYFGAVGGGVWKTMDAGTVWTPVFDGQGIASIGAIEVAPSDPNIIYVGTGETDLRSDIAFGDGVYKSTDAGATWKKVGLRDSRQIGRILVHPTNPNIVLVAALGHAYGPNEERGVFRSTDGGATWRKVLYKGPDVGAVDLAWAPDNPETIWATLWNAHRPARIQYGPVEGPGSGLYRSTDGGDHWNQVTGNGLPPGEWRRSGIAVARGLQGRRVYLLVDAKEGGLFRSDDSGNSWTRANADPRITERGWYFGRVTVDPNDPDTVYLPNIGLYRSKDAGKTLSIVRAAPGGDDYHFLWVDPANSSRMILATDQGATISVNGGKTWTTWYNQPTGQFYHAATDNQFPYLVYGTQQDSGTAAIASRTNHGQITEMDRQSVGGSESGYIAPDPVDPNIVYVAGVYGGLTRFDKRTAQGQNITPWPSFRFAADLPNWKYRYPWTPVLVFSPVERGTLYFGSQYLMKTTDGGLHWTQISPDLTGTSKLGVVFTIAPSALQAGLIWTGSDTGLIHLTRDGGATWTDVTPKGLEQWSKVTRIEASHFDPATAWAAVDRHRLDDYHPHLYQTHDYGKTWTEITGGLAEPAFLNAICEDPVRRGLLFAGTELGVAVSFDDGGHWQPLQLNLPAVSVRDILVHGDDLVVATHGRSFWILDDIAPLREANTKVASSPAWLYSPAPAIRTSHEAFLGTPLPPEIPHAENPPEGAVIDYYLSSEQPVTLEILDGKGLVVRRIAGTDTPPAIPERGRAVADIWITPAPRLTGHAGMNRYVWDLRFGVEGSDVKGPQVLPGTYTARLTVSGRRLEAPVTVLPDPRSNASPEELERRLDLGLAAVKAIERSAQARTEIADAQNRFNALKLNASGNPAAPGMLSRIATLEPELSAALQRLTSAEQDMRTVLEVAESADRRPPAQATQLFDEAARSLDQCIAGWKDLEQKLPR